MGDWRGLIIIALISIPRTISVSDLQAHAPHECRGVPTSTRASAHPLSLIFLNTLLNRETWWEGGSRP